MGAFAFFLIFKTNTVIRLPSIQIQESKDEDETEVSEERKEAAIENKSFEEYLEELCSNEDFARKVGSFIYLFLYYYI